jgi:hypothetical protein
MESIVFIIEERNAKRKLVLISHREPFRWEHLVEVTQSTDSLFTNAIITVPSVLV